MPIDNPYLEICFRPTIATINEARRMIVALYQPILGDGDAASRVALTAHELLENAIKYSLNGKTVLRVEISRERRPSNVTIETRNAISPERREALDEVFAEMARFHEGGEYYRFAIQRTRTRRHGSGLGLARIWAEGEMSLSRAYDGDEVRIIALAKIPEGGR